MVASYIWSSLQSLFRSFLTSLGLSGKEGTLVLLGLDNAGKTTLVHRLKTGGDSNIRPFPPTDRPTLEEFKISTTGSGGGSGSGGGGVLSFSAWDLGGHEAVRHLYTDYVSNQVSAVLFVVDAADTERLEEAAYELDALVGEGLLQDIPVAVLLNKCDLAHAMSTQEICERLEFERLKQEQQKIIKTNDDHQNNKKDKQMMAVFRISVLKGEGYQDAFRWIGGFL